MLKPDNENHNKYCQQNLTFSDDNDGEVSSSPVAFLRILFKTKEGLLLL